ncbi:MAG: hypothetical protein K1X89_03260 [Myxococcaceae bacterium]|nr:hypothetical protein [Myxococcaceae bacterium]
MSRAARWAILSSLSFAVAAWPAEITRVASSFEDNKPFGMFFDIAFDRVQEKGRIDREWHDDLAGGLRDVSELRYQLVDTRLKFDAHIGLYQNLELHIGVPIVFQQDRSWTFSKGTDESNTTLYRNCQSPSGGGCASPGQGTGHLFEVGDSSASFRSGLGNLTFGLAWAPFVQAKDDTKPTWVVAFDYTAPTAAQLNPSVPTTGASRGAIGDRVHRYQFSTSISKRIKIAEPYFQLHYTLPYVGPGAYSNCDDASATRLSHPENCGQGPWVRAETGIHPQHVGGFVFGSEITAFEKLAAHQKVAFDLRGWVTYTSQGRVENELSDMLGKLLQTGDFMELGGQIGFTGQAAEFIALKAFASLGYRTEHSLTGELVGQDLDGTGVVDLTKNPLEVNPNFDFRVDRPGARFRIAEQYVFRFQVAATFSF